MERKTQATKNVTKGTTTNTPKGHRHEVEQKLWHWLTSTLLSSQRTTTHHPWSFSDQVRGNSPTLHIDLHPVKSVNRHFLINQSDCRAVSALAREILPAIGSCWLVYSTGSVSRSQIRPLPPRRSLPTRASHGASGSQEATGTGNRPSSRHALPDNTSDSTAPQSARARRSRAHPDAVGPVEWAYGHPVGRRRTPQHAGPGVAAGHRLLRAACPRRRRRTPGPARSITDGDGAPGDRRGDRRAGRVRRAGGNALRTAISDLVAGWPGSATRAEWWRADRSPGRQR
jgi:hypothetical protein